MTTPTADSILAHWFRPTSGAKGIADAESAARELFVRLAPWMAGVSPQIEWKRVESPPRPPATFGAGFELASSALLYALEQEGITREALAPEDRRLDYVIDRVIRLDTGWRMAVERHLEVLPATWPPSTVRGKRFAELANPFEPILQIWDGGYLLEADDETARLFSPIATLV
jgi:hypothetical protein